MFATRNSVMTDWATAELSTSLKTRFFVVVLLLCFASCTHRRPEVPDHLPVPADVYYAKETRQFPIEIDGRKFKPKVNLESNEENARDYYGTFVFVVDEAGVSRAAVIETTDGRMGVFGGYAEETWGTAWSVISDGNVDIELPIGDGIVGYLVLIHHSLAGGIKNEERVFEVAASDLPSAPGEILRIAKFSELPRVADRPDAAAIQRSRKSAENYASALRGLLD
jgi:hypothetical protein